MATVPTGRPAWSRKVRIGDYDGATDKQNVRTETVPYAWTWYQEFTGMLGSGFTNARTGLVHAKKLALARVNMAITRAAEKLRANSHPATADEELSTWVYVLKVRVGPEENRHEIRQRAGARFIATNGPTWTNIDTAFAALLGDSFVQVHRTTGADLDTPPAPTHWPGVNPGSVAYDLGGGTWLSSRAHFVIEVAKPSDLTDANFLNLVNIELFRLADELFPASATFNWAADIGTGFLLDISELDFVGLTPT